MPPPQRDLETTLGALPFGRAFRWYAGLLFLGIAVAFAASFIFGIHPLRGGFAYGGALNLRWFTSIREDFIVRWIMIVIGVALLGFAIFAPEPSAWE
jgi:hypothetical protein